MADFPAARLAWNNIEAKHPDDFILDAIDLASGLVASCALRLRFNAEAQKARDRPARERFAGSRLRSAMTKHEQEQGKNTIGIHYRGGHKLEAQKRNGLTLHQAVWGCAAERT